jgi:amino acid adenylation domain-containing protein
MKYLIQHFVEDTLRDRASQTAIKQGDRIFTYGEIDELSRRYQTFFSENCSPDKMVGILSRVRAEAVVAMLGALRAGIKYVPMNTLAPASWLGNVVKGAELDLLLVDSAFMPVAHELKTHGIKQILCIDEKPELDLQPDILSLQDVKRLAPFAGVEPNTLADDIAYVLYTSGSTGSPKGIMITHRNAFTFIDWMQKEFKVDENDRVFNRAPLQFDLSVFDIFSTFQAGAQLVIAPMGFSTNALDVVNLMREEKVTICYTVPSTFINWISKGGLERDIPSMRLVLYAGEPFPVPYLRKFMECLPNTKVSNIYGPTETNIVTYFHINEKIPTDWESVPIGKAVHDTEIYIVDEDLKRLPQGEIGEILVRGGTVFAGYFNEAERTRERLIQSPFHSHPTLCCRTGDLGKFLPDGNIVYHGRADNMVKTRGYRVEIGEVESAISSISGVDELAVIAKPHEKYGNSLHAFVACAQDGPSTEEIISQLTKKIPSYMMPYEVVKLDSLPKTSTGKIDRVGLKAREGN